MIKRIFGYIFLGIAIILGLCLLLQFKDVLTSTIQIFRYFITDSIDDYTLGHSLGHLLAYIVLILITIGLFVIGRKWTKKNNKQ